MSRTKIRKNIAQLNGCLGYFEVSSTRENSFHPCYNFTYRIKNLLNSTEISCQRACIAVTIRGVELEHMVCLPSKVLSEPNRLFQEVSAQIKGVPVIYMEKVPLNEFVEFSKTMMIQYLVGSPEPKIPVESIGLQHQLLEPDESGRSRWKRGNVEFFLHPRVPILGADGKKTPQPTDSVGSAVLHGAPPN